MNKYWKLDIGGKDLSRSIQKEVWSNISFKKIKKKNIVVCTWVHRQTDMNHTYCVTEFTNLEQATRFMSMQFIQIKQKWGKLILNVIFSRKKTGCFKQSYTNSREARTAVFISGYIRIPLYGRPRRWPNSHDCRSKKAPSFRKQSFPVLPKQSVHLT